jgi:hypothetical protein
MRRRRRKNSTGFPAIAVTDHPIAGSHTHISSHGRDVGHPCLKQGCRVSGVRLRNFTHSRPESRAIRPTASELKPVLDAWFRYF